MHQSLGANCCSPQLANKIQLQQFDPSHPSFSVGFYVVDWDVATTKLNWTSPIYLYGYAYTPNLGSNNWAHEVTQQPANGVLTPLGNGAYRYVPRELFVGVDSFKFKVFDGNTWSNEGTVNVSVNDAELPGSFLNVGSTPPSKNVDPDPGASGDLTQISNPAFGYDSQLPVGMAYWQGLEAELQSLLDDEDAQGWIDYFGIGGFSWSPQSISLMKHFLGPVGLGGNYGSNVVQLDVAQVLLDSQTARDKYTDAVNSANQVINTLEFVGNVQFVTKIAHYGTTSGSSWRDAIGEYTGWLVVDVVGTPDAGAMHYTASYTYHIWDPYDWNPNGSNIAKRLAKFHLYGLGKQFLVEGSATSQGVSWNQGELPAAPPILVGGE